MQVGWRVVVSALVAAGVLAAAAAAGWISDTTGRDRAFTIEYFDRVVLLEADGTTYVEETIDVRFHQSRRGIFRDLPAERRFAAGDYHVIGVDTGDPNVPWRWVVEPGPDGPRIRIGDASVWLSPGDYRYRLRYVAPTWSHVLRRDRDQVETRIDIPGFAWPTNVVAARLRVLAPADILAAQCVEGPLGSTRGCAGPVEIDGDVLTVELGPYPPRQAATVAFQLPADEFSRALPVHSARPLGSRGPFETLPIPRPLAAVLLALFVAAPLLVIDVLYARHVYRDRVTDPALHDRLHPRAIPAPPRGLRPPEVAGLLLRRDANTLLLSTLVDLDQRGVVRTTATGSGKKLILTVQRGDIEPGDRHDRAFVDALIPAGGSVTFADAYSETVAKRSQAASKTVVDRAQRVFATERLQHDGGRLLRTWGVRALLAIGVILWVLFFAGVFTLLTTLPGAVIAVVAGLAVVGWGIAHLPWRHHRVPLNSEGRDVVAQTRSFDEFVRTVEREQIDWAAGQHGIDHLHPALALLPHAIALGHADSWFDRFGTLMRDLAPVAAAGGAAGGSAWWAGKQSFNSAQSSQRTTSTAPSSSSSGGGGGGSGGGGGGGGSW